jgi:nucleotide-binding universal stress UspA family protein
VKKQHLFRRILVPVDLSPTNRRSLEVARDLAARGRARVTLIHVIEMLPGISFQELKGFYQDLYDRALKKMETMAAAFARRGIKVSIEIPYGKRAEEIIRHASSNRIDLIVLTSHEVDLRRPARGLGSVSYQVGILSKCPVLLLK